MHFDHILKLDRPAILILQLIYQLSEEIGFNGVLIPTNRDEQYQKHIDKHEKLLDGLKDNSPDSSITVNAEFFGMINLTTDYKHIKRIKNRYPNATVMRPSEFLNKYDNEYVNFKPKKEVNTKNPNKKKGGKTV